VPPIHPSLRMEATGTFGSLQNTTNISFVIIKYVENSRTRLVGVAAGTLRDGAKARLQQGFGELLWHLLLLPSMRWVGCSMHPWPPHISQKSWAHMDASLYYRAAALLSSSKTHFVFCRGGGLLAQQLPEHHIAASCGRRQVRMVRRTRGGCGHPLPPRPLSVSVTGISCPGCSKHSWHHRFSVLSVAVRISLSIFAVWSR
jgi:hypothetical protein